MWYGLLIDDTLADVKWFKHRPTIFDFNSGYISSHKYSVVKVNITITETCDPLDE